MKAFVLSALFLRAVHAQQENESPADPGTTLTSAIPAGVPSPADVIPPGTNDIVLPSAGVDGLATAVLNAVSSVLDGTRFGPSVEPVSRSLPGASGNLAPSRLPGQPAPIVAPAPLKAPAPQPSPTGKARTGGFAGLSVDEGDPQPAPEEGSTDPVDGQSADTPTEETPVEETPVEETPVEEQPADEQPVDEQPADNQPLDEQPTDEQPTDEQPTDEQPTDDQPTDDQPTDDQPTDDQPTDDQPTEDQPTDQPTDDQPTDDQPTDDQPTDTPTDSDNTATPDDQPSDDPDDTPAEQPDTGNPDDSTDQPSDDNPNDDPNYSPDEPANGDQDPNDPNDDPNSNPAGDPQLPPEDDPDYDQPSIPDDNGGSYTPPTNGGPTGGKYPGSPRPGSWSDEPWNGGNPSTGGVRPPPLPIGPSGYENEDNGFYDGEDYGNGPAEGKGKGKPPSGTQGNGYPDSGHGPDEDCPAWCLEDDSSPVETSAAPEATHSGYKGKHKRKKTSKSPHRIAVSVDDNVIYDSNYARDVADDAPSAAGFAGFSWPTKHIDSGSVETILPSSGSDSNGPPAYGRPYPYEETTDHPYDSQFDQNTDYDDHDDDKLPQWLVDLQNGKSTTGKSSKGKKGKKKAKGKCPKSCIRTSTLSTFTSEPTDFWSTTSEDTPTPTDEPIFTPTTFITIATDNSPLVPSTDNNPSSPTSTGKAGLPAGYVSSGDTWTGTTLAGICPKTCNPFNPAENFCGTTTGCTTTGGRNYYCACRAGYKVGAAADKDFSQQFKVPGQPYVYTWPGAVCDELCEDQLCNEVMLRSQCF